MNTNVNSIVVDIKDKGIVITGLLKSTATYGSVKFIDYKTYSYNLTMQSSITIKMKPDKTEAHVNFPAEDDNGFMIFEKYLGRSKTRNSSRSVKDKIEIEQKELLTYLLKDIKLFTDEYISKSIS